MRRVGLEGLVVVVLLGFAACSGQSDPGGDAGPEDAAQSDAGDQDNSVADADLEDAGPEDASMAPDGAGPLDGADTDMNDADTHDAGTSDGGSGDGVAADGGDLPAVDMVRDGRFWHVGPLGYPGLEDRMMDVYLPEGYDDNPEARYPVLYMHDGQNLFDPAQAAFGVAWDVDATLDDLTARGIVPAHIVVGVHNTPARIDEYTPDEDPTYGGGAGDLYADFLAQVLKPLIDFHFRTQPGRESTSVAGSSLGGIISLHIFLRYPDLFGRVGAVSPSLWWNDRSPVHSFEDYDGPLPARLWLDMGTAEGDASLMGTYQVESLRLVRNRALERGMVYADDLGCLEDPGAGHNESAWAKRLDSILTFLLGTERALDLPPTRMDLFLFHRQLVLDSAFAQTTLATEALHAGRLRLTWPNEMLALDSSLADVASVDVHGNVQAHAVGESSIRASMDDLSASQVLLVSNPSTVRVDLCAALPPGTPDGATIYVTGDQPAWGPWDPAAQALECEAGICHGSLIMPLDTSFAFKFTRGSWETVEKHQDCSERPNRQAQATGPVFEFTNQIEAWADLCP